ncbi:DUF4184 family protein [Streptomyces sp. NBC_00178]|uniref:DUF4184 family protein n=1 Tax=Streptomyces sp. NBC_00178 TaxID=2975672 RepID=UPI002E2DFCD6|nr:DUF4184 family protein [Streptomyces sp. NBC_00178]
MPFTLSHAAAVLPGVRRSGRARGPLVASALVAGSFAPDVTYYADSVVPGAMEFGEVTHAAWGVFGVDVLITGALVALWLLVREPLLALLPGAAQGRVHGFVRGRRWEPGAPLLPLAVWFAVSAVIGSGTHVVWDAFTHHDRWGTELIPVLGRSVGGFPVFQIVQYGSSALAAAALAFFVSTGLRAAGPAPRPESVPVLSGTERLGACSFLALCVLLGTAHRCARWFAWSGRIDTPLDIIPTACFGAGAGLAAGLVLYGAWMRLRRGQAGPGRPEGPGAETARTSPAGRDAG